VNQTRWRCRICFRWGVGGPVSWLQHWNAEHNKNDRFGSHLSFGFTGDYSSGNERRYDRRVVPAVAAARGEAS